jgi:hypothetical protein
MTPGFRGYTVGNASTPPNRTRVHTLQWNIQWHCVAGNFVIVYSVFGQSHHLKTCTGPYIITVHLYQYNFTYKDSYHIVSRSVVMTSTFITIIPWLFHSPLTCKLVYNTNSYISMHYHHVNAYDHNLNSVSTYQQL